MDQFSVVQAHAGVLMSIPGFHVLAAGHIPFPPNVTTGCVSRHHRASMGRSESPSAENH